ncbi:hypothetical protein [Algiphilus aromaticivorans]|uniref:hypothetical protein n=1 Tax=Algiphilus aromaticivorans TaxID=382454 RepID=UPI0012EC5646|nr:hypothetical protein [Algiphilus aromaticivorans]
MTKTILPMLREMPVERQLALLDKTVCAQAEALQAVEAAFNAIAEAVANNDLERIQRVLHEINATVTSHLGEAPSLQ